MAIFSSLLSPGSRPGSGIHYPAKITTIFPL
jgi:hypothetical protein